MAFLFSWLPAQSIIPDSTLLAEFLLHYILKSSKQKAAGEINNLTGGFLTSIASNITNSSCSRRLWDTRVDLCRAAGPETAA